MSPVGVWSALGEARRHVASVVADGRGEAAGPRGAAREYAFTTSQAVLAAANPALLEAHLMFVVRNVGAATNGLDGAELPIVFGLVHEVTGETVEFPTVWPLANPADYASRLQARAATITSAEKHQLLHLLAINVVDDQAPRTKISAAERHGKSLDDLGAMPAWGESGVVSGPPPELLGQWHEWRRRDFLPRSVDASEGVRTWPEFVGQVLKCEPRECRTAEESARVAAVLRDSTPPEHVPWRALQRAEVHV